jgi:hypothetical protein
LRRDVQDPAFAALEHGRHDAPDQVPTRPQVQLEHVRDLLVGPFEERAKAAAGRVVHQDVDRAELVLDLIDERAAVERRLAHVEGNRDDVGAERRDLVARLLQRAELREPG